MRHLNFLTKLATTGIIVAVLPAIGLAKPGDNGKRDDKKSTSSARTEELSKAELEARAKARAVAEQKKARADAERRAAAAKAKQQQAARQRAEAAKRQAIAKAKAEKAKKQSSSQSRAIAARSAQVEGGGRSGGAEAFKKQQAEKAAAEQAARQRAEAKKRAETAKKQLAARQRTEAAKRQADAKPKSKSDQAKKQTPKSTASNTARKPNSNQGQGNARPTANRTSTAATPQRRPSSGSGNTSAQRTTASAQADRAARNRAVEQAARQRVANTERERSLAAANSAARADVTERAIQQRRQQAKQSQSRETAQILQNKQRDRARNAEEDFRRNGRNFNNDNDATALIAAVLGGGAIAAVTANRLNDGHDHDHRGRLPLSQVGRTQYERTSTVDFLKRRLLGQANYSEAPQWIQSPHSSSPRSRFGNRPPPHYYNNNTRVVRYSSYDSVPPVLLGYNRLNQVQVNDWQGSAYYEADQPSYYENIPEEYVGNDSVAVSYPVDPDSAVTEDDVLFRSGSSELADAYSYDLIVDMAEAISSTELQDARFVVEGHASAEGSYSANLQLSQQRAERIASDLVDMGVAADRVIPVGYGESEAQFAETAPEEERQFDRRVMVFRLQE